MKIRYWLLGILVLAQMVWLSWRCYEAEAVLAAAPTIEVEAKCSSGSCYPNTCYDLADPACLGKSLWWNAESLLKENEKEIHASVTLRPQPPEGVTGALNPFEKENREKLVALWHRGADGMWRPRIEAAGSSEDVLREGEVRTPACLVDKSCQSQDGRLEKVILYFNLFYDMKNPYNRLVYDLDPSTSRLYRDAPCPETPPIRLKIALRRGASPVVREALLGDEPLSKALRRIQKENGNRSADSQPEAAGGRRNP